MKRFILLGVLMSVVTLGGCAGSGDVFQLRLHDVMHSTMENAGGNLSVAVSDFGDQRPPSEHLGSHVCIMGHITYFDLMDSNLGKGVSDAFVGFLQKSGFQTGTNGAANVRITGNVITFSANATGHFLSTTLQVDTIMDFVIANVADGRKRDDVSRNTNIRCSSTIVLRPCLASSRPRIPPPPPAPTITTSV